MLDVLRRRSASRPLLLGKRGLGSRVSLDLVAVATNALGEELVRLGLRRD